MVQDTEYEAMRTVYGGFTVKGSLGIVAPSSPVQGSGDSSRFRLVTEGYSTWLPDGAPAPQGRSDGEAAKPERKYVGISATLYANGEAVAVNRYDTATFTGGTVYLGKDALGSVRGATNDYGLLEERYEYDAFGKPYKGDLNSGMNLGYTGKPYDTATGMYNYGYRDYQPEVARFTTIDPIRDGANWFAYVNNDPVNWVDLWGLSPNDAKNNIITTSLQTQGIAYNAQYSPNQTVTEFIVVGAGNISLNFFAPDNSTYSFVEGPAIIAPSDRSNAIAELAKDYGGVSGRTVSVNQSTVFEVSLANSRKDELGADDIQFVKDAGGTIYLSNLTAPKGGSSPTPIGFVYVSPVLLEIVDNTTGTVIYRRK
jgi:RHS repeat-associated protein